MPHKHAHVCCRHVRWHSNTPVSKTPCAGTFSGVRSKACSNCMPGSYTAEPGAAACIACAPGVYQGARCLWIRQPCTYTRTCASTHAAAVARIMPGTIASLHASTSCTPCKAGYIAATAGASACTACGYSSYTDGRAGTSCQRCPAGTHTPGVPAKSAAECVSVRGQTVDVADLIGKGSGASMYLGLSPLLCKWDGLPPGVLNLCEEKSCSACTTFAINPESVDAARALAAVLPSGRNDTSPPDFRLLVHSVSPDAPQCSAPLSCPAMDELGNAGYIRYDELMRLVSWLHARCPLLRAAGSNALYVAVDALPHARPFVPPAQVPEGTPNTHAQPGSGFRYEFPAGPAYPAGSTLVVRGCRPSTEAPVGSTASQGYTAVVEWHGMFSTAVPAGQVAAASAPPTAAVAYLDASGSFRTVRSGSGTVAKAVEFAMQLPLLLPVLA